MQLSTVHSLISTCGSICSSQQAHLLCKIIEQNLFHATKISLEVFHFTSKTFGMRKLTTSKHIFANAIIKVV